MTFFPGRPPSQVLSLGRNGLRLDQWKNSYFSGDAFVLKMADRFNEDDDWQHEELLQHILFVRSVRWTRVNTRIKPKIFFFFLKNFISV